MSYLVFNPKSPLSARVFVLMVRPSVEVTRGLNLRFKKKKLIWIIALYLGKLSVKDTPFKFIQECK